MHVQRVMMPGIGLESWTVLAGDGAPVEPVERWLASKWSSHLKELKGGALIVKEGWIESKALSSAIDEALNRQWAPQQLWNTLLFEHWLRRQRALAAERSPDQVLHGA